MAFIRVQGKGSAQTGAFSSIAVTLNASVTNGNTVLAGFAVSDSSVTVSSATDDKGNTYQVIGTSGAAGAFFACSRTNITNAPTTITFNTSTSGSAFWQMICDEFSGTSNVSSDERDGLGHAQYQNAPGTGTDAITSGTFTTSFNGSLVWGITSGIDSSALATHGTGFADSTTFNSNFPQNTEFLTQAAASISTAATFTAIDLPYGTIAIAIKALGAVSPTAFFEFDQPGIHITKKMSAIAY